MRKPSFAVVAMYMAAALLSCSDRKAPSITTASPAVATERPTGVVVGPSAVAVHRDRFGVGAIVRNAGMDGMRDIELSIRFFAGDDLVLSVSDVLAFCPGRTRCPWATSFGIDTEAQRSIDSADVSIARVGPAFDGGVIRQIELGTSNGAVSYDLPARRGVAVVYAARNDQPYFGMFKVHQVPERETIRLFEEDLPVGPETRAVFYEGHVPASMLAGGD